MLWVVQHFVSGAAFVLGGAAFHQSIRAGCILFLLLLAVGDMDRAVPCFFKTVSRATGLC
jgi:hypothetical protein